MRRGFRHYLLECGHYRASSGLQRERWCSDCVRWVKIVTEVPVEEYDGLRQPSLWKVWV